MCLEDPPLLRGVVLYTLMCISAKVAIVGKNTYKRSEKCVKMITVFEPIPLPAFPDAFFFILLVLVLLYQKEVDYILINSYSYFTVLGMCAH